MLYQVGILVALLSCICAGVCLSSLLILAICHTFNLAFIEFSIHNELQELSTSIDSSLFWLVHRTAALATGTIKSIKSPFLHVPFKSKTNYAKIIAQKDQELAQLRQTAAHQAARIELLETRNAAFMEADTPPADPLIAQQAAEIAEKDARISSLINTTVRQADVEAQLRKKLADKKAKVEDQEVRIALISGDMSCLEDQVKKLEGEKHEAFATAKAEGVTAQVQEVQEARAVAEEGRKKAQDRLVEYEELLENAAFDVREMQSKVAESKKIDPYIYRQTVQQVHSLHAERDEARAARNTAINESLEAKIVESETIKRMVVLLEDLKSAIDVKDSAENEVTEIKCKLDKAVQIAEDKARDWQTKYKEKAGDFDKTQKAFRDKQAELRNETIRADIKSHSEVVTAQGKIKSLENQLEILQTANDSLDKELQRFKKQARHTRNAKQPIDKQVKAQESSGQSKEELQAHIHTLSTRVQELENTAERDEPTLRTRLQKKIDELQKANLALQQRPIPPAATSIQDTGINLQQELNKQRTELEDACRRLLADKDNDAHRRVDAVIQERNTMEQRLRNEMVESENNLKELANKLWDEKRAELDIQIEQANYTLTNLRADLKKLEEEKKTAIEKVETDYEYLLLDVDRLNEEVSNLKQAAKDRDANFETAETGKRLIDGDIAMTFEPTSTTSSKPAKPTSAFGQPSFLPPFGAASQQSVPFTFGANAETVPAAKPLYSGTAAGKKPANDLLSFDVAGNALADDPPLFRAIAGNQPADNPFSLGAAAGNQPAKDPFSFGVVAGAKPANNSFSFSAVAGNQPADNPFSLGTAAGNQPAKDPFSFGAVAGNKPADNPFTFGALGKEKAANNPLSSVAPVEDPTANEQPSFGSLAGGTQVDQSKPPSPQPPTPTPANPAEKTASPTNLITPAQPLAPVDTTKREEPSTPATSNPSTQPSISASPNSPATATSTPPSIPEKKPTPVTAAVTAAQAGGKAIALAAAAKIKADKAAALEARRASDVREEFARNTPHKLADKLLEQLQGSNGTLQKITKVVESKKRMTRVEDIHEFLCTSTIPDEKSFNNIDSSEWPVLHAQLKDVQDIFDDLDKILEDYRQLRWEGLLALLTKPRRHDPVEDVPMTRASNDTTAPTPPAAAGNSVALPGLYPDGNTPATPRVIKPMPRIRRGPNKLIVTIVD